MMVSNVNNYISVCSPPGQPKKVMYFFFDDSRPGQVVNAIAQSVELYNKFGWQIAIWSPLPDFAHIRQIGTNYTRQQLNANKEPLS